MYVWYNIYFCLFRASPNLDSAASTWVLMCSIPSEVTFIEYIKFIYKVHINFKI